MKHKYTATSANILSVEVETNCPKGGDEGHGGKTTIEFRDEGGTVWEGDMAKNGEKIAFRMTLFGDTECQTMIECLRFAADALEKQVRENIAKED